MVRNAPTYPSIADELQTALANRRIVVYNADYDSRILRQATRTYFGEQRPVTEFDGWQCAMTQYSKYYGAWNDYFQDYRWQKLPPVPGVAAHGALADCLATRRLLQVMATSY
jgi:DNA polymerase-3 subunit epsilon